jgi:di/tricarboxylate transporter
MPMSHAAIFGGLCTLVGTSTNIVADEFARTAGLAGFSMFEPGKIGIPLAFAGFAYVLLIGRRFLPKQSPEADGIELRGHYVAELVVGEDSSWIDKPVDVQALSRDRDIDLIRMTRNKEVVSSWTASTFPLATRSTWWGRLRSC